MDERSNAAEPPEQTMGTPDASVGPAGADAASHVPVAFFGEHGMGHHPEGKSRAPIAAGLFGVVIFSPTDRPRGGAPVLVRDADAIAFGIVARGGRTLP